MKISKLVNDNEIRLIVAGGREFNDVASMEANINKVAQLLYANNEQRPVVLVSGMARGADTLAYEFAKANDVCVYEFPANWDKYGKSAGYRRNEQMAAFGDVLLVFWDGKSKGTKHMIDTIDTKGKPVFLVRY